MPLPYTRCPKCGHADLPSRQDLPAACPACGVILAKVGQVPRRTPRRPDTSDSQNSQASWATPLTRLPDRVDPLDWWARFALLAGLTVWAWTLIGLDYRSGDINASFLHRPLLIFHEAGHVIFMPLGQWMMILGGTLGQLLMPAIMSAALQIKNRDPFGAAVGLWLLGVSVLDVAPYVYDALQPQLMLLSGSTGEAGGHDWIYLLSSLGLLPHAQLLGSLIHKLGALVVLASLGWAACMLRGQYRLLLKQGRNSG
jgi:hypothetical protein